MNIDLKLLNKIIDNLIKNNKIPGLSIGIVQNNQIIFKKSVNMMNHSIIQLASVSKFITAYVLGSICNSSDWETSIQSEYPWFELENKYLSSIITVKDSLSQRSGFEHDHMGDIQEAFGYNFNDIIRMLKWADINPNNFRNRFEYQNYMFTLGTQTILKKKGINISKLYHDFFNGLDMIDASIQFDEHDPNSILPRKGVGECKNINEWKIGALTQTTNTIPAAGISASLNDMIKFLLFLLGKQNLVSDENISIIRTPHISINQNVGYGIGCFISGSRIFHDGLFGEGINNIISIDPKKNIGYVILTNGFPSPAVTIITDFLENGKINNEIETIYWNSICPLLETPKINKRKSIYYNNKTDKNYYNNFYGTITIHENEIRVGKLDLFPIRWFSENEGDFKVQTRDNNWMYGQFMITNFGLSAIIGGINIDYSINKINNITSQQDKFIHYL